MNTTRDIEELERKLKNQNRKLGLSWVLMVLFLIFSIYLVSYFIKQSIYQAIADEDISGLVERGISDGFEDALKDFEVE